MAVVRYLVDDVDRATAFYTDKLGFELEQRMGPAFAIVSRGDISLWLSGPQSSAARPMPDGRQPEPGEQRAKRVQHLWLRLAGQWLAWHTPLDQKSPSLRIVGKQAHGAVTAPDAESMRLVLALMVGKGHLEDDALPFLGGCRNRRRGAPERERFLERQGPSLSAGLDGCGQPFAPRAAIGAGAGPRPARHPKITDRYVIGKANGYDIVSNETRFNLCVIANLRSPTLMVLLTAISIENNDTTSPAHSPTPMSPKEYSRVSPQSV